MIIKKPYAFFIKMFKPIHLLMSGLVLYLIYISNNILKFFNNYLYSSETIIEQEVLKNLISNFLYIIPVIIIVLFLVILSIMYKKNKPVTFYFVGIFSFIVVLVINVYTTSFFEILFENVVSIKTIKLIHDLVLINIIIESFSFGLLFARGLGINFKKFDFNSDTLKLEISESDKEDLELNINFDFNEKKRKRKEKIRKLKYAYMENKFFINILIIVFISIVIFTTIFFINKNNKVNKEGIYYSADSFVFKINKTRILNTDYHGNKITDNYLIVVDTNIKSNRINNSLYLNDFSLKIGNTKFKPVRKYFDSLIDLGLFYDEQILSLDYDDYLFVYEIPEKYIKDEMYFSYNNEGNIIDILLSPKQLISEGISKEKKLNEKLEFSDMLSGVEFKISNYSLNDKILIEYDYCIKENDCIKSREYLKPSIDENYDKVILKIDIDYTSNSKLDIDSFYKLLSKFGIISYKINDVWYNTYKFEEITSKRVFLKNSVYIGVNSNIYNADSIKIVFDVRDLRYEYILK